MINQDETFNGTWPYEARFSTASGFRQHYVDEGVPDGEVLLCLHGEPTWGYLYRNFLPELSKHYRVIVPDHMGLVKVRRLRIGSKRCKRMSKISPTI